MPVYYDFEITCNLVVQDGHLISGSDDGRVRFVDASTGQHKTIIQHDAAVECLTVLRNGTVVSGGKDNTVRRWERALDVRMQFGDLQSSDEDGDRVHATCLRILKNGCVLEAKGRHINVWDPIKGQVETVFRSKHTVSCLNLLSSGAAVYGLSDNTVLLSDQAMLPTTMIIRHSQRIACLEVLSDDCVVSGSWDKTVELYDPVTRQPEAIIHHKGSIYCLAALPNGNLASGSGDKTVRLWDRATRQAKVIIKHKKRVTCLAVLPGSRVASGSSDQTVCLWDSTMEIGKSILKHQGRITCLVAWADGVVSADDAGTVCRWSLRTEQSAPIIQHGHASRVNCIEVMRDDRVLSGGDDGTLRLWDPATNQILIYLAGSAIVSLVVDKAEGRAYAGLANGEMLFLQLECPTADLA